MVHGFRLIKEQRIAEINAHVQFYKHEKSGAEFINAICDDENKVFGIAFKTLPDDSTGVAHILEHSVLCGSRRYPVKEPFIELAKGSLNTYLNASTYPDKTVYPVASTNTQDLYNLVNVYLDCVLYPQLSEWTFKQEGWHYELETEDQPMIYKGVVYNEMKGAYSSADGAFYRHLQQALLPDTIYGVSSGGDPVNIPDLTYAQFKQFWQSNYHPSNARIWWYGNDDADKRMEFLDGWLGDFDARPGVGAIGLQTPFISARSLEREFDAGDGDASKKSMASVAWLMSEPHDETTKIALEILAYMLVGTSASPLRKALIDSGLGDDLAPGSGYRSGTRQDGFAAGLKGMQHADTAKVEGLVTATLSKLVDEGFPQDLLDAAFNTIEFRYREANFGGFPRGIAFFLGALDTWLHNEDPFSPLIYEAEFATLKARLATGEPIFANLIRKYLLGNSHRVNLHMHPSSSYKALAETAERARLDAARAVMSPAQLQQVIADTATLKRMQTTPDAPEDLAKIPALSLADLPRTISKIPTTHLKQGNADVLHHDLFTNGIVYLDVGFDWGFVAPEDRPLMSLFGRFLLETGTDKLDQIALSRRIGRRTGGIGAAPSVIVRNRDKAALQRFWISGKSTVANTREMLAIMREVLLGAQLGNRTRIRQIVMESKSRYEAAVVSGGNRFASARLRASYFGPSAIGEQLSGVTQLLYLRELVNRIDKDWDAVQVQLEKLRLQLVNRNGLLADVTVDGDNLKSRCLSELTEFIAMLPANVPGAHAPVQLIKMAALAEGLSVPSQVNYVGKAANLFEGGYTYHGSAKVAENLLRTVYLWERIRTRGGAYGGSCGLDDDSGVITFSSYRDPNLLSSLDVYDEAADFLRNHELSQDEVRRCIIGVIGDLDSYQLPDAKGNTAMRRWLTGYDDGERQQRRDEVLGTTVRDIRKFGEALASVRDHGRVCVVGGQDALLRANQSKPDFLTITQLI